MRIVGLFVIAAVLMAGIGANITFMFDPPSMIIICGMTLGGLMVSGAGLGNMFGTLFAAQASAEDLAAAARAWAQARVYAVAAGGIGVVIGTIIMARNMDDWSALGPGLSICLLTVLYGLVLGYGVFLPLQRRLEDRARLA